LKMAQKRKNEDITEKTAKRHKGELPVCQIDGITMAIPHEELIASALRVKGFQPAVPFQINRQTGQAFVQLKSMDTLKKIIAQKTIRVSGVDLEVKQLPPRSNKLYGLRDSFVWRNESLCFFEASTGLCYDPGQGIYLYWDSVNQVYTRVPGDGTKPPSGPPAGVQRPAAQQQYGVPWQAGWAGQPQHQQLLSNGNIAQPKQQQLTNNQQNSLTQQPSNSHASKQPQSTSSAELGSIKVKLEIEKNASNFLRKQFNKIKQERDEAQKLLKEKDQVIAMLSSENKKQREELKNMEAGVKKKADSLFNDEMKEEIERLRESEDNHIKEKSHLQEELAKMNEKVKVKEEEWKQLVARKGIKSSKEQMTELKNLIGDGHKISKIEDKETTIKKLKSEFLELQAKNDELVKELSAQKGMSNITENNKVELVKTVVLNRIDGPEITISPDTADSHESVQESEGESSSESKRLQIEERERNEERAKKAEEKMHELRKKMESFGELFADVRGRVGNVKNSVKLNSMKVEHNLKSVRPRFNNLLDVLRRVSGICEKATSDLENFNDTVLSTEENGVHTELKEISNGMNQVAKSFKDLDYSFVTTQPTFGVLAAEVEHHKADVSELRMKLQEAEKALLEEKSRREEAESMKEDLSELKKLFKKKKRRRPSIARKRSYSRSRSSSSRSRSSSYSRRR